MNKIDENYYSFVNSEESKTHNLTNNQVKFIKWLLENHEMVSMIGSYYKLFFEVRSFIKNNYKIFDNERR